MLRTAEGLGIEEVIFSGYTPYPELENDSRLPHIRKNIMRKIHKAALGAEKMQKWRYIEYIDTVLRILRNDGYTIAALELEANSVNITKYSPPEKIAILVGSEVDGIDPSLIGSCDLTLEIPMSGQKESFNVSQAAAIAMYSLKYFN
jgi:23S rRNA (guanosine2251-2'-O)-methyltransferase